MTFFDLSDYRYLDPIKSQSLLQKGPEKDDSTLRKARKTILEGKRLYLRASKRLVAP